MSVAHLFDNNVDGQFISVRVWQHRAGWEWEPSSSVGLAFYVWLYRKRVLFRRGMIRVYLLIRRAGKVSWEFGFRGWLRGVKRGCLVSLLWFYRPRWVQCLFRLLLCGVWLYRRSREDFSLDLPVLRPLPRRTGLGIVSCASRGLRTGEITFVELPTGFIALSRLA